MDAELKAKWIDALRSGEFSQCRQFMHYDGGYCCLGVLAKVQGKDEQWLKQNGGSISPYLSRENDWPTWPALETARRLADMNDGRGGFSAHDFAQIADYIDANL